MFTWFDKEIKEAFGIDILDYDFNKEQGCQVIRKDNVDLMLVKTERLDDCQKIIGEFVGASDFKIEKTNVSDEKSYKFAYDELKRNIKIPKYILDFYYNNNDAVDHFYTAKWKGNRMGLSPM